MPIAEKTPKSINLTISGQRVHAWAGGAGPCLLLLHSAWGDAEMSWVSVWKELSSFFTVIAPDMPGFGASDALRHPSLARNAALLKDLLDSLKIDSAIVLGNSFGAGVAGEFAAAFPERTIRLVLVNGGFLPALPRMIKSILAVPFIEKGFRKLMRTMTYSDKAFARAFPNPGKLPPKFFARIRAKEENQARIVFDTFMNQASAQQLPSVPVTIIWGTGDRLTTMKQAGVTGRWPVEPDFVSITGAGHMPQLEAPMEFIEAVKKLA